MKMKLNKQLYPRRCHTTCSMSIYSFLFSHPFCLLIVFHLMMIFYVEETDAVFNHSNENNIPSLEQRDLNRSPRIIGGTEVKTENSYPFMTLVSYDSNSAYCGGSLIAPNVVLTAAHCDANMNLMVYVGRHDLSNDNEIFESIAIEKKRIHPRYDPILLDYDYMLLKLEHEPTIPYSIVQIDDGSYSSKYKSGKSLRTMGWGSTVTTNDSSSSDVLLEVDLGFITEDECNDELSVNELGNITTRMICAQDFAFMKTKAACSGDSGGPLLDISPKTNDLEGNNPVLVGIMSWSGEVCMEDAPDVFARVSDQYEWIQKYISKWYEIEIIVDEILEEENLEIDGFDDDNTTLGDDDFNSIGFNDDTVLDDFVDDDIISSAMILDVNLFFVLSSILCLFLT